MRETAFFTAFSQDQAADALPPGPALAALTARAVSDPRSLTDDELTGVLQAGRRLENLAAYQQTLVIAEFARRRQEEFEAAKALGGPVSTSSMASSSPWNWLRPGRTRAPGSTPRSS